LTADQALRLEPTARVRRFRLSILLLMTVALVTAISSLYQFSIAPRLYAHYHWAYDQSPDGQWRHVFQATIYTAIALIMPGIVMFAAIARIDRAHSQLREALDAAQVASTAKSRFLANMSHELRTPLNAVIGFSDVMGAEMFGPLLPRYREYTTDIRNAGVHLLNIINDVLDISKAEAAEFRVHLADTGLGAIFADVEMMATGLAAQAMVDVKFAPLDAPVLVHADRVRLTQCLLNLVSYGIKFNKVGGDVAISATVQGKQVHIEVRDNGIGMAPGEIIEAFEPFVQLNSGYARRFQGTGLGLPLTRMLVEAMQGTLTVESQTGIGTRISMRLPLAAAAQIANAA